MALSDRLAQPVAADARRPRQFAPGVKYEGSAPVEVSLNVTSIEGDEVHWRDEIKRVTGLTIPDEREVILTDTRYWGNPDAPMVYAKFVIRDRESKTGALELEGIIKAVKSVRRKSAPSPQNTDRALVVALADLQAGKVGSRGGSEALVERVMSKLDALDEHAKSVKADTAILADLGDCIESVENVASQAHTNDLSVPEQLRLSRRLFTEAAIRLAKTHSRVIVTGVPSNHARWRKGKDQLGRPGDDYGLENLTAIADAFSLNPEAFGHVEFMIPNVWEESLAIDVHGTILAMAHGHQANNPDRVPAWWAGQVHGGQPAADADILLTGHFHFLRVQPTGRSAHTGRSKWWFQCPTLDNGSDWWRIKSGSDSDPGLLTFTVDANGWDSLKLL